MPTQSLNQQLDRVTPALLPLPTHSQATHDSHVRRLYATVLASLLLTDGPLSESQARLFGMLLEALALPEQLAAILHEGARLEDSSLIEFLNLQDEALTSSWLLDALILCRLDAQLRERQQTALGTVCKLTGINNDTLQWITHLACACLGIHATARLSARLLERITLSGPPFDSESYVAAIKKHFEKTIHINKGITEISNGITIESNEAGIINLKELYKHEPFNTSFKHSWISAMAIYPCTPACLLRTTYATHWLPFMDQDILANVEFE